MGPVPRSRAPIARWNAARPTNTRSIPTLTIHLLPNRSGGGGGAGQPAKDATGADIKSKAWLKTHLPGDHTLSQGLKVRVAALHPVGRAAAPRARGVSPVYPPTRPGRNAASIAAAPPPRRGYGPDRAAPFFGRATFVRCQLASDRVFGSRAHVEQSAKNVFPESEGPAKRVCFARATARLTRPASLRPSHAG